MQNLKILANWRSEAKKGKKAKISNVQIQNIRLIYG